MGRKKGNKPEQSEPGQGGSQQQQSQQQQSQQQHQPQRQQQQHQPQRQQQRHTQQQQQQRFPGRDDRQQPYRAPSPRQPPPGFSQQPPGPPLGGPPAQQWGRPPPGLSQQPPGPPLGGPPAQPWGRPARQSGHPGGHPFQSSQRTPAPSAQKVPQEGPLPSAEVSREPSISKPQPEEGKAKAGQKEKGKKGAGRDQPHSETPAPIPPSSASAVKEVSGEPSLSKPQPEEGKAKAGQKGKGKKGAGRDQPHSETPAPIPPSSASAVEDVTKKIEKASISATSFIIPRRKCGQEIKHTRQYIDKEFTLDVNYLPIRFKDMKLKIFHYHVTFKPLAPKSLFRPALRKLLDKYVPNRHPAFDGRESMYSGGTKLNFPNGDTVRDTVKVFDQERLIEKEFDITVNLTNHDLSLARLADYMKSGTSLDMPQDVIQGTDIALRHAPISQFVQVGRSFFSNPGPHAVDLGGGFDLWHGYYQSAIMAWKPYMNVDVANKAFPKAQSILDYLRNVLNVQDLRSPLDRGAEIRLRKFLKGLKVEYRMPSREQGGHTRRTYKVDDLGPPPRQHRFKPDKAGGGREITVEQYFREQKGTTLAYPNLPTIKTSNGNMLPLEFCDVAGAQAVMRKLDERQTAVMVRNAAKPTDQRRDRIMRTLGQTNFANDPCLKEFGISIDMNFEKVDAVVLRPPKIQYQRSACDVRNGVWRTSPNDKFIDSPGLRRWVIFNTDRKINQGHIQNLVKNFRQAGFKIGIEVSEPLHFSTINVRNENDFSREFQRFTKQDIQIFVVIMTPFGIDDIYSKIKRAAELDTGILTQCLKSNTVDFRKMNEMTATNILLKINSKISGVNHTLLSEIKPQILKRPVMVVGADVTHPAPGSEGISIAAVAASHDQYGFQYNMLYRLQPSRQEIIDDFESMITEQLKFFYTKCRVKPERILYYRDGVSEGQFQKVLNDELRAMRRACEKVEQGYKPGITFLVVQKRHHTRFFPGPRDWDGDRNKNVVAGTLVDTKITHPTELDFYLVSHQSIQGTARPTKYHLLWDDNDLGQEELEQLTYYLCHMFARCNRSVSYPAPTYYAHLAAFRARAWWDGQRIDTTKLASEQANRGRISEDIVRNTPMFFV